MGWSSESVRPTYLPTSPHTAGGGNLFEIKEGVAEYVGNTPALEIARLYQDFRRGGGRPPMDLRCTIEDRTRMKGAPTQHQLQPLFDTSTDRTKLIRIRIEDLIKAYDLTHIYGFDHVTRMLMSKGFLPEQILVEPGGEYSLQVEPVGVHMAIRTLQGETVDAGHVINLHIPRNLWWAFDIAQGNAQANLMNTTHNVATKRAHHQQHLEHISEYRSEITAYNLMWEQQRRYTNMIVKKQQQITVKRYPTAMPLSGHQAPEKEDLVVYKACTSPVHYQRFVNWQGNHTYIPAPTEMQNVEGGIASTAYTVTYHPVTWPELRSKICPYAAILSVDIQQYKDWLGWQHLIVQINRHGP